METEGRHTSDGARWNLIHPKVNCDHSFHTQTEAETSGVWVNQSINTVPDAF